MALLFFEILLLCSVFQLGILTSGTSLAEYEYDGPYVRFEEHNYAAAANGARVVSLNIEARGGGNILNRYKDQYYSSPCSAEDKFVVVELSKEIFVGAILIASYNDDSSHPRDLEILGSLEYPAEEWKLLGRLEAKDDIGAFQVFILPRSDHSVRYLKLRILSHHREETLCTLGTMMVYEPLIKRTRPQVFGAPFKPQQPPSPKVPPVGDTCTCKSAKELLGEEIQKILAKVESCNIWSFDRFVALLALPFFLFLFPSLVDKCGLDQGFFRGIIFSSGMLYLIMVVSKYF
ncbi:hypothetical protein SELMODRAFT_409316 [Selaginella moellendorffii]|uniref:SUN domain-containing protein n=1 Tax=Selaginella moellendorffii TaxID=88036 RepID=D8RB23_SELML|nr:hypothetical protein SELMODRAFT_409316 [Selaginella moellendorffii]